LFSAKLICVEFYPRTSPITIAGDRTVRWAKSRHAAKQGPSLGKQAQRSPPNLCSVGYTTFTALLHDKFLRPTGIQPADKSLINRRLSAPSPALCRHFYQTNSGFDRVRDRSKWSVLLHRHFFS
jgi:hypothetical protein